MRIGFVHAPIAMQSQAIHDFLWPVNEEWIIVCMDEVLQFNQNVQQRLHHLSRALPLIFTIT